jgi:hypothetical protein
MYEYDAYKVESAIEAVYERPSSSKGRPRRWRAKDRQWDAIICTVCVGCGKPLGRYENLNRLAYCFDCRRILFPETINVSESHSKGWPQPRPRRWQSL